MKRLTIRDVLLAVAVACVWTSGPVEAGQLRAWGSDSNGQVSRVPSGNSYVAVAAGDAHGLALRADGTVVAWGQNDDGQCGVPQGIFRAIGAGADFSLAIRDDGSLAAWGGTAHGQIANVPPGRDFVAVAGGEFFAVALRADGSLVSWGNDRWGQVSGTPKGNDFKAVVAGDDHAVALRSDGSLVSWGYWAAVQDTPKRGTFAAIAAGGAFCVALGTDGSLVWWGADPYGNGLAKVPVDNDFIAVAAGYRHGLALRKDGSVVGWGAGMNNSGFPHWGQADPRAGKDCTALAGGLYFSLALTGNTVADISDNFNDNKQGGMWKLYGDDLSHCWLEETDQRLNLRATMYAREAAAFYLAHGWHIDPTEDFSFRVGYHYGLQTNQTGWVSIGLTPDVNDVDAQHVEFAAGCDKLSSHFWYEVIDGGRDDAQEIDRRQDDGVLYVSYDAASDHLYLSSTGYGAKNAWAVISGKLQVAWGARPLRLYLGGGSHGLEIKSGSAYLDDFVVETGGPVTPSLRSVHRFWSPGLRQHFYTIDEDERDRLLKDPRTWTYEGAVFKAAATPYVPDLTPVYRFRSVRERGYFYTVSVAERDRLQKRPGTWAYEDVAFYAYPEGAQPSASRPVYRFWAPKTNDHFYTTSPSERDTLIKEYSHVYAFEGVAFYGWP